MDYTAVVELLLFSRRHRCNWYLPGIISFSVRADLCQGLADVSAGCSCRLLAADQPGTWSRPSPARWMSSRFRSLRGPGRPICARQCRRLGAPSACRLHRLCQTSVWTRMGTFGSGTEARGRRAEVFGGQGLASRAGNSGS